MNRQPRHSLVVGPVLLVLLVSLYRAWALATEISPDWTGLFTGLLLSDGVTIGAMLLAAGAAALAGHGWLRRLILAGMMLAALAHMLDAFIVLALDQRLSLLDLRQYVPEFDVVASFFGPVRIGLVFVFLASLLVAVRPGAAALRGVLLGGVVLVIAGLVLPSRFPAAIQPYTTPALALLVPSPPGRAAEFRYDDAELPGYLAEYATWQQARPPDGRPDMILLIVESLSSINSLKTSGVRDWLPEFDRLSDEGMLFVNFFANHAASEGGIIALNSGFPPMHYPTARPLMFEEMGMQLPVLRSLQTHGYYTIFLTTTRLDFINMDRYLEEIGFDEMHGRDEINRFANAPRYAQDAPPDDLLYAEALQRMEQLESRSPWFMVLTTSSSHLPYAHPAGGPAQAPDVWAWVQAQIVDFHHELQRTGFYENGILLITGDHRHMRPITDAERERYGDSAKARVPLLVIGAGIPSGVADPRFFQQSDLLRKLAYITDPHMPLSPNPIWVKRYNRKYGKLGRAGQLTVFAEADASEGSAGYELRLSGDTLQWVDTRPPGALSVETRIHAQRAAHQAARNRERRECLTGAFQGPAAEDGAFVSVYADTNDLAEEPLSRQQVDAMQAPDGLPGDAVLVYQATLHVEEPGDYWFLVRNAGIEDCVRLNGQTLIAPGAAPTDMVRVPLPAGRSRLALLTTRPDAALLWLPPGAQRSQWSPVPVERSRVPAQSSP